MSTIYKRMFIMSLALCLEMIEKTCGASYYVYSSNNDAECVGGPNDTCDFYCDVAKYPEKVTENEKKQSFDCGNVGICNIHCTATQCLGVTTLKAESAGELNVYSSSSMCLAEVKVFLPDYGNAYFVNYGDSKSFKRMKIYSGLNTGTVWITCNSGGTEECNQMELNVQSAKQLYIPIGRGIETISETIIHCPVNSSYNGDYIAPCVIYADAYAIINKLTLNTQNGIPKDAWIYFDESAIKGEVIITSINPVCNYKLTLKEAWTKESSGACWNTNIPTNDLTINPTINPTSINTTISLPTIHPLPSVYPSLDSLQPSTHPINDRTKYPITSQPTTTYLPTDNPTINPTSIDTTISLPTIHQTSTSFQPSIHPTNDHTKYPITSQPTISATTLTPTSLPTTLPTPYQPTTLIPITTLPTTIIPTSSLSTSDTTIIPVTSLPRYVPSMYPSLQPSIQPMIINPTSNPSLLLTHIPSTTNPNLFHTTNVNNYHSDNELNENKIFTNNVLYFVILILLTLIFVIICMCICSILTVIREKKKRYNMNQNTSPIAIPQKIAQSDVNLVVNSVHINFNANQTYKSIINSSGMPQIDDTGDDTDSLPDDVDDETMIEIATNTNNNTSTNTNENNYVFSDEMSSYKHNTINSEKHDIIYGLMETID